MSGRASFIRVAIDNETAEMINMVRNLGTVSKGDYDTETELMGAIMKEALQTHIEHSEVIQSKLCKYLKVKKDDLHIIENEQPHGAVLQDGAGKDSIRGIPAGEEVGSNQKQDADGANA